MFTNSSIKKIVSVFATSTEFHFEKMTSRILRFEFNEMSDGIHYELVITKFNKAYSISLGLVDDNSNYVDSFDPIYECFYNLNELCNRIQFLIDKYDCKF